MFCSWSINNSNNVIQKGIANKTQIVAYINCQHDELEMNSFTCLPELSVSEDWYNDQQVAQNIYYNRSDQNTGE